MEIVPLLRQCPPALAENYAVTVCDMNAALLEKQQELLAQAEQAPLEHPPPSLAGLEFSKGGKRLLLKGWYGAGTVIDTASGEVLKSFPEASSFSTALRAVGRGSKCHAITGGRFDVATGSKCC